MPKREFVDFAINVDLSAVEPWGGLGGLLPEGPYLATITAVTQRYTKHAHPYLAIEFTVIDERHAGRTVGKNYFVGPRGDLPKLLAAVGASLGETAQWRRWLPKHFDLLPHLPRLIDLPLMISIYHSASVAGPRMEVGGEAPVAALARR